MLLKGKGSGGLAPPFLNIGGDSEDEAKTSGIKPPQPIPIPTSVDSDDGK